MPKAITRASAARTAATPYPVIKPGDTKASRQLASRSNKRPIPEIGPTNSIKALVEQPTSESNVEVPSKPLSFLNIHLPEEDTCPEHHVPCYDTCSTIRHKITQLLGPSNHKPENLNPAERTASGQPKPFTKASLSRALGFTRQDSLSAFLKRRERMGGAENEMYPAAYRFFEQKRVFEGKRKTKEREKIEREYVFCFVFTSGYLNTWPCLDFGFSD